MANPLSIRMPFANVPGSQAGHYTILDDYETTGRTVVRVDDTDAMRRLLQPPFAGKLTFKPAAGQTIPADPSLPTAQALVGDLFLEMDSPAALRQLANVLPAFAYPPMLAYLGVAIDSQFFRDIVLAGVALGKNAKTKQARLTKAVAFAAGNQAGRVDPPGAVDMMSFATMLPAAMPGSAEVTLVFGTRVVVDAHKPPIALSELSTDQIFSDTTFIPLPLAYWYEALARHADWNLIAGAGHDQHPFLEALRLTETAQKRWRRLRCRWREDREATPPASPLFDGLAVQAVDELVGTQLWARHLNVLGELFTRRGDSERFRLSITRAVDGATVSVAVHLGDAPVADVALEWNAPSADAFAPELDLSVFVPWVEGDPAALQGTELLHLGLVDYRGWTVEKKTGRVVFSREYVLPLQRLLVELGFEFPDDGGAADRPGIISGTYDRVTSWAVREFQIYAGLPTVAKLNASDAVYANSLRAEPNTARYLGQITGAVDAATAQALTHWRANELRCPVIVETRMDKINPNVAAAARKANAWWPWQDATKGARAWVRDYSGLYVVPPSRSADARIIAGMYDTPQNGTYHGAVSMQISKTTWEPEATVTPEHMVGRELFETGVTDAAAISTFKVIAAVAAAESNSMFDSINAYDGGVASAGVFHWTLYLPTGKHDAEMPALLAYLSYEDAAEFDRLFGRFGLEIEKVWPSGPAQANGMFRPKECKWTSRVTLRGLAEGGPAVALQAVLLDKRDAEYFRSWHWFYRFVMAGRTSPSFRRVQWDVARMRLRAMLGAPWRSGAAIALGEVFTTERGVCVLLRSHVNAPGSVIVDGHGSAAIRAALDSAKLLEGKPNGDLIAAPSTWTPAQVNALDAELEKLMTAKIGGTVKIALDFEYVEGNQSPSGHDFGKLSAAPGSFKPYYT